MSVFAEPLAQARDALAIAWPEGDHVEPNAFTELLAALDLIERRAADVEKALRLAVHAFAQYALETNEPPEEAVTEFVEGFLQDARLRDALAVLDGHK